MNNSTIQRIVGEYMTEWAARNITLSEEQRRTSLQQLVQQRLGQNVSSHVIRRAIARHRRVVNPP